MAEAKQTNGGTTTKTNGNGARGATIVAGAQEVADRVRLTAERAADRLPEAAAVAQTAARDTQRALDEMPNQALIAGTGFAAGLAAGLYISGAPRLLVLFALAPAAAMAATLMGRESTGENASTSTRRAAAGRG